MLEINKIYNMDCLEGMKMIPDKSIDMILCDLPYGVTRNKWDSIISLDGLWSQYKRVIKPNGAIVLTSSQPFTSLLIMSNQQWFKYSLVWDKRQVTGFLNAKKMPLRRHEDILVFYNKTPIYNPQFTKGDAYEITRNHKTSNYLVSTQKENSTKNEGIRYPTSIIDIPHSRFKNGHPTQKPVNLFEYLILTYTNSGMTVLDNCIGSGTTAEACINTKRDFIGFEIEEQYCKMANERIEKIHNQNVS